MWLRLGLVVITGMLASPLKAQTADIPATQEVQSIPQTAQPDKPEPWNLFVQATSVGDAHGRFRSPYSGPFSLQDRPERDVSLTTTLFLGVRLARNTELYVNPEIAGGRGFSGVNGVANAPNGELPRVASATPTPYLARAYVTQDFPFGDETEDFSSDENQLGGPRSVNRYSVTVGRFTLTDFFDNNRYAHDPRTQFLGWAVMYNGAWDYPADVRGYTWGWVHELHRKNWALRYGSAAEPRVANGLRFDRRIFRDRGDVVEGEVDYSVHSLPGAVRLLGYINHTDSGNYGEAIRLAEQLGQKPDVTSTRRVGTAKRGVGISADEEVAPDIGVFLRLGWNDGKTESFAFTAIDRLASGGVSVTGSRWNRPHDVAASAFTASGISAVHASYLAKGGNDFLIGDGALRYGPEEVWESYYNCRVGDGFFVAFDLQHIVNPAYNRDRGPVWVYSLRLHLEFGKDAFRRNSSKGPI
jgi:high affinity Mn2+ porin